MNETTTASNEAPIPVTSENIKVNDGMIILVKVGNSDLPVLDGDRLEHVKRVLLPQIQAANPKATVIFWYSNIEIEVHNTNFYPSIQAACLTAERECCGKHGDCERKKDDAANHPYDNDPANHPYDGSVSGQYSSANAEPTRKRRSFFSRR